MNNMLENGLHEAVGNVAVNSRGNSIQTAGCLSPPPGRRSIEQELQALNWAEARDRTVKRRKESEQTRLEAQKQQSREAAEKRGREPETEVLERIIPLPIIELPAPSPQPEVQPLINGEPAPSPPEVPEFDKRRNRIRVPAIIGSIAASVAAAALAIAGCDRPTMEDLRKREQKIENLERTKGELEARNQELQKVHDQLLQLTRDHHDQQEKMEKMKEGIKKCEEPKKTSPSTPRSSSRKSENLEKKDAENTTGYHAPPRWREKFSTLVRPVRQLLLMKDRPSQGAMALAQKNLLNALDLRTALLHRGVSINPTARKMLARDLSRFIDSWQSQIDESRGAMTPRQATTMSNELLTLYVRAGQITRPELIADELKSHGPSRAGLTSEQGRHEKFR